MCEQRESKISSRGGELRLEKSFMISETPKMFFFSESESGKIGNMNKEIPRFPAGVVSSN